VGTVALSRHGVDFAALDGEPVDIFFLLISPQNQPGDHLRALEKISRHLKDERFVRLLRQARARENVIAVLEEADQIAP
jgi:mannitol/fructose-specific phosphotransferase system IIA component (Ntr-type)